MFFCPGYGIKKLQVMCTVEDAKVILLSVSTNFKACLCFKSYRGAIGGAGELPYLTDGRTDKVIYKGRFSVEADQNQVTWSLTTIQRKGPSSVQS